MSSQDDDSMNSESEEALLYSSRHGELKIVKDLLKAKTEGSLDIDVSCKGKHKSNLGWTPLHLATYFGHVDVVEALLSGGADINAVNDIGDTALHKASFIGNEDLVVVLLKYGADVQIMNGEGKLAKDVSKTQDIYRLLAATEQAELRDRENRLLKAAKEGNLDLVNKLLVDSQAPSINCVDAQGNTCLHCVAYRGHAHVAAILLQNGIDPTIRNSSGQLAIDLAKDKQMREVLSVRPMRQLQRTAARFEGALLKRSRFLGWRHVWAVLQRGVLVYYGNRAEAASTNNFSRGRRDKKYLDGAKLTTPNNEPGLIMVQFSDGDSHKLAIPRISDRSIDIAAVRQSWITAFNEHIAYSGHYLWVGAGKAKDATENDDEEDDTKPLGSMQDALTNAANSLALFENQLKECTAIVKALENTSNVVSPLHQSAIMRFQHAGSSGSRALTALRHGCALAAQAREQAGAIAKREAERARVLEDALAALARQHHDLEMSVAEELHSKRSRKKKKSSSQSNIKGDDTYQDAFSQDSDSDTLVTAGLESPLGALSPWGNSLEPTPTASPDVTPTNSPKPHRGVGPLSPTSLKDRELISSEESMYTAVVSPASSLGTLVSYGGHVYRNARDDAIYRASSKWSL